MSRVPPQINGGATLPTQATRRERVRRVSDFGRRPAEEAARRLEVSQQRAPVALRLALGICLCAGMLFFTPWCMLPGKAPFVGKAMAAETGGGRSENPPGLESRMPEAKEQSSGPSRGQAARQSKVSPEDPLNSRELTRALSRLLSPEQSSPRVPSRPSGYTSGAEPTMGPPQEKKATEPARTDSKREVHPSSKEGRAAPSGDATATVLPVTPPVKPVAETPTAPTSPSPPRLEAPAPVRSKPHPPAEEKTVQETGAGKTNRAPAGGKEASSVPAMTPSDMAPASYSDKDSGRPFVGSGETGSGGRGAPASGPAAEGGEKARSSGLSRAGDKDGGAVEIVSRQNIVRAEIKPINLMLLTAPCDGVIASIPARDGDSVDKGQTVARLDTRAAEQSLAVGQTLAADAFERLGALPEGPSRERDALAAEYLRYSAEVRAHETVLAQGVINAPFAGTVTEVYVKTGEHVKQGSPLVEIAETGSLEVVCAVPSAWLRWLKPGHIVWVYVDETGKSYEAVLARLGGKVDPTSKTLRAYAHFSAPPADLLPGMSGSASIRPQLADERAGSGEDRKQGGTANAGSASPR